MAELSALHSALANTMLRQVKMFTECLQAVTDGRTIVQGKIPAPVLTKAGQQRWSVVSKALWTPPPCRDTDGSAGLPAMKSVPIHLQLSSIGYACCHRVSEKHAREVN